MLQASPAHSRIFYTDVAWSQDHEVIGWATQALETQQATNPHRKSPMKSLIWPLSSWQYITSPPFPLHPHTSLHTHTFILTPYRASENIQTFTPPADWQSSSFIPANSY